ncbi:hypothetical protein EG240_01120 [Paenimyroides tangerinum]|uniref:Uncharacterized protein n=1 Tax=Paenimyroides tangerinum TaxID=2488728 RepID=A0A3P3WFF0_9FLAO|nr:hypothetical protein [Paenimyroides tangerinum]RRJ93107.1 hypothetical protein EG240_01120 [Paenimyroides tangerinum]
MKNKSIWSILLLVFSLTNCNSQHEMTQEQLNELIEEEYNYVTQFESKPFYRLQINKQACRLVIESYVEDYRFLEDDGESMLLPINYMIAGSGPQKIKVKVYPRSGETYITKNAYIGLNLIYASTNRAKLNEHQSLATFTLPKNIEEQKLPYFEGEITFDAFVPYNYVNQLNAATDLKQLKNIRELVENKYKQIHQLALDNHEYEYIKAFLFSYGKLSNTHYATLEEVKWTYKDGSPFIPPSPKVYDKKFLPLDDCEMQFYADGKIVALWHKNKLTSGLDMEFKVNEDGEIFEDTVADPIFLWMPEGSNELLIW